LAERQPKLAQAQFLLGRLAVETENWDEAITRLTKAVELDPDHDGAWTALGYVYETRHQPEDAIKVYRKAMQANPDNPGFVERLSDLLIRLGRFNEAQSEVETLAEAAPRDARVWLKLGAVYYEQKMWERAADSFRRAVVLEPSNLRARYFLATSLMDAGRDDDARGELERILRLDPRSVDARVQLGFLHGRGKRYDQAIAVLREAVNIEPRRPELFLYLGSAYFRAKQYDRAVETLKEGLSLDEKQKDLIFQLGVVYEKQQKFDDAVKLFRRVIVLDPQHAEAYNFVGYMYAEKGQKIEEAKNRLQWVKRDSKAQQTRQPPRPPSRARPRLCPPAGATSPADCRRRAARAHARRSALVRVLGPSHPRRSRRRPWPRSSTSSQCRARQGSRLGAARGVFADGAAVLDSDTARRWLRRLQRSDQRGRRRPSDGRHDGEAPVSALRASRPRRRTGRTPGATPRRPRGRDHAGRRRRALARRRQQRPPAEDLDGFRDGCRAPGRDHRWTLRGPGHLRPGATGRRPGLPILGAARERHGTRRVSRRRRRRWRGRQPVPHDAAGDGNDPARALTLFKTAC